MIMRNGHYTEANEDKATKDNVLLPLADSGIPCKAEDESQEEFAGKSVLKQKNAESGGKIIWRVANGLMTIFFVMAVGVQFNDPDPYLWVEHTKEFGYSTLPMDNCCSFSVVPLYGIASLLTTCVTIQPEFTGKKWWKCIYWIHTVFCSAMFCYVFVELIIVAASPKSDGSLNPLMYEEGRELAGIMITVIWLFTCKQSPTIKSKHKFSAEYGTALLIIALSLLPLSLWALCYSNVMSPSYISFCGDFFMDEFSF